jgi:hypothetical protein
MGGNRTNSTYTVSLVVHEAREDGTGTLTRVDELLETKDYAKAIKLAKRITNTEEGTRVK